MKLRTILNFLMVVTNLVCLIFIVGFLFDYHLADYYKNAEVTAYVPFRFKVYMLYITSLFNLYFIFYLLIKKRFKM